MCVDFIVSKIGVVYVLFYWLTNNTNKNNFQDGIIYVAIIHFIYIFGKWKSIKNAIKTIFLSLLSSFNESAVLIILSYCYLLVGIKLFGFTRFNYITNKYLNFRNSKNGLSVLFSVATNQNWSDIIRGFIINFPNCEQFNKTINNKIYYYSECSNSIIVIIYFFSYYVILFNN